MINGPCEVPLLEQLQRVPDNARAEYEHGPTDHSLIPYGRLCREAAVEIEMLTAYNQEHQSLDVLQQIRIERLKKVLQQIRDTPYRSAVQLRAMAARALEV